MIFIIVLIISSTRMDDIGIIKRSLAEFDKSLSCHNAIFSKETFRFDLTILANEEILSLFIGFFFTGYCTTSHLSFLKWFLNFSNLRYAASF